MKYAYGRLQYHGQKDGEAKWAVRLPEAEFWVSNPDDLPDGATHDDRILVKYEPQDQFAHVVAEPVEPVIRLYFCDVCCLTTEEFERLQREVTADAALDPDRMSTKILAQLIREHRGRYLECVKQKRKQKDV